MADITAPFSERELDLIALALADRKYALNGYIEWINDRPMLPARETAIDTVRSEVTELLKLQLRLYQMKETAR